MNERIRELALQAGGSHYPDVNTNQLVKFAELIISKCAGLFPNVYVEIETDYGHTPVIAADYIKKHFGVEGVDDGKEAVVQRDC